MWFGTSDSGLCQHDGAGFVTFTKEKSNLAGNRVHAIHETPDGILWIATHSGVSRYDGKGMVSFTTQDGMPYREVMGIHQTADGVLWFAGRDGVARYDGRKSEYACRHT